MKVYSACPPLLVYDEYTVTEVAYAGAYCLSPLLIYLLSQYSSPSPSPPPILPHPKTNSQGVTHPLDVITLHHKLLQVVAGEWQQRAEMGGTYTLDVQKHVRKILEFEIPRNLDPFQCLHCLVCSCSQMCVRRIPTYWGRCVLPLATGSQQQGGTRGATRRNRSSKGSRLGVMSCR